MGDFNARIGSRIDGEEQIIGTSYYGQRNERGNLLARCAMKNRLKIANTFFPKPNKRKWTWISPKGKKHEIDYILTSDLKPVEDVEAVNLSFDTDHRMVQARVRIKKKELRKQWIKEKKILSGPKKIEDEVKYHEVLEQGLKK